MKHRGEIVGMAIHESGMSQAALARKMHKDRKTIYNYIQNADLPLDIIVTIGKIIKYDFRKDFPEIFIHDTSDIVMEPSNEYSTKLADCIKEKNEWKSKYYELLEENSQLKSELLKYRK